MKVNSLEPATNGTFRLTYNSLKHSRLDARAGGGSSDWEGICSYTPERYLVKAGWLFSLVCMFLDIVYQTFLRLIKMDNNHICVKVRWTYPGP